MDLALVYNNSYFNIRLPGSAVSAVARARVKPSVNMLIPTIKPNVHGATSGKPHNAATISDISTAS